LDFLYTKVNIIPIEIGLENGWPRNAEQGSLDLLQNIPVWNGAHQNSYSKSVRSYLLGHKEIGAWSRLLNSTWCQDYECISVQTQSPLCLRSM